MANAFLGTGGLNSVYVWSRSKARSFITWAITILLVLGIYLIWHHFIKKGGPVNRPLASVSQIEKSKKDTNNTYLKNNDYASYQSNQQTIATEYLTNNDPDSAERVMNDVIKKVPASQVTSASYSVLFQVEKAKKNTELEKKYLALMITKLKAEGKTDTAVAAQKVLDGLK